MKAETQDTIELCSLGYRMRPCLQKPATQITQWSTGLIVNLVHLWHSTAMGYPPRKAADMECKRCPFPRATELEGSVSYSCWRADNCSVKPSHQLRNSSVWYCPVCLGFALAQCFLATCPLHLLWGGNVYCVQKMYVPYSCLIGAHD